MRSLIVVSCLVVATAVASAQLIPAVRTAERRTVQTTDGKTIVGLVLGEGMADLQLRSDDQRIHLLRKAENGRYRTVTSQRDWTTYHGDVGGNRYSTLTQITKSNVTSLAPRWMFPLAGVTGSVETTPLVIEGVMYLSTANEVWALDAGSGRELWHYQQPRTKGLTGNAASGINRGVAASGDRLFMLTDHAHIIALNRFTGERIWDTAMADWKENYNSTSAPLVVGSLVIAGSAGGDEGVRGYVAAFESATGKGVWRIWTVPNPGEPGAETWQGALTAHRGGAAWMTGTYDPELDLVYWPTGNPGLDYYGNDRLGDNLYTDSVLALEAKTGKLRWHFQFTPHDVHDWDAQETPVIVNATWRGQPRKLLLQANRNGFFYVLDRVTGEFLLGKQFLKKLNWASGLDAKGRPILNDLKADANGDTYVCPGFQGGTNWFSTAFNPATGLYYSITSRRSSAAICSRRRRWNGKRGRASWAGPHVRHRARRSRSRSARSLSRRVRSRGTSSRAPRHPRRPQACCPRRQACCSLVRTAARSWLPTRQPASRSGRFRPTTPGRRRR
jgi:alcohol dehydrogenase (cytochrome c)